jgi:hypothetical protein
LNPGHNISPGLRKQLVLELEVGEMLAELVERLPGSVLVWKPTPDVAALLSLERPFRTLQHTTIEDRQKSGQSSRRVAAVLLQQPHVEDVVDAGALRQLQAVGDAADALQSWNGPA